MPNYVEVDATQIETGQYVHVQTLTGQFRGCGQGGRKVSSARGDVLTIVAPNGERHEYPITSFASGDLAAEVEQALPASECLEYGPDCRGPVDYRIVGSALRGFPRCEHHLDVRLDRRENSMERYADSASAPSWFDPSYAGESWDED